MASVRRIGTEHRNHALYSGRRYFASGIEKVSCLPLVQANGPPAYELTSVPLPPWARDLGPNAPESILVDSSCVIDRRGMPKFECCDWLRAAFLHSDGWLERKVEDEKGPIQSFAARLPRDWLPAFARPWSNWIYLFIRRWVARHLAEDEEALFGPRPTARFLLTHDVDALCKTVPLRIKSTVMNAVATARHVRHGRLNMAFQRTKAAVRYLFTGADYWLFEEVCEMERQRGFRSVFLFADKPADGDAISWLLDPSYKISDARIGKLARDLVADGWEIGIHPGFKTWADSAAIGRLRAQLSLVSGQQIELCRQHWLRFSWFRTWRAQQEAGVRADFTLGFNDRPGFRNGAALFAKPWDWISGSAMELRSMPTLLMDSQFYDYDFPNDVSAAMMPLIDEVMAVGGEAALLWHIHTLHPEYGWARGYEQLLDLLVDRRARVTGTWDE